MACRLDGAKPLSESMLDIVNWTLRNKLQWAFNWNSNILIQENALETVVCEMASILSRPQCVQLKVINKPAFVVWKYQILGCNETENEFILVQHAAVAWWRHQMETFSALLALCAGNSPVQVTSPHKGQWRGALMFSLVYAWINDWINNREAGDWDAIVVIMTSL